MTTRRADRPPVARPRRGPLAGARQATLREANLRLVLHTIYAAEHPPSRADVAGATDMTRSTVSRLVDDLVRGGFVAELDPAAMSGPGRPATPLVPAHASVAALGLQVNAGFLAAVVVDLAGATLAHRKVTGDFVGSQPGPVLARLGDLGREVLAEVDPALRFVGAGLALPGIVVADRGRLLRAPNLGWHEVQAVPLLGPLLAPGLEGGPGLRPAAQGEGSAASQAQLSVRVCNEADLAAWAVAHRAPARPSEHTDFIYLTGELGIGGAIVVGGHVLTGRHGWAGELGHMCVDPHGPSCRCGSTGCLEQYVGGGALRRAAGLPASHEPGTPSDARPGDAQPSDAREQGIDDGIDDGIDNGAAHGEGRSAMDAATALVTRAREGEPDARAALEGAAWALSIVIAGIVNALDISTVVLGGHLAVLGEEIHDDLAARLRQRVLSGQWVPPRIVLAADEEEAGALGGAMRALDHMLADPARWLE